MLSAGWIVFWKAVVLGVFSVFADWWNAEKARRYLNLRPNKDGVYVPDDRMDRIERIARRTAWTSFALCVLATFWMVGLI